MILLELYDSWTTSIAKFWFNFKKTSIRTVLLRGMERALFLLIVSFFYDNILEIVNKKQWIVPGTIFCLRYEFQVSKYYVSGKQYKMLRMREISARVQHSETCPAPFRYGPWFMSCYRLLKRASLYTVFLILFQIEKADRQDFYLVSVFLRATSSNVAVSSNRFPNLKISNFRDFFFAK